jgi:glycosyltransferase involved in cell wall biosynthesis
MKTASKSKKRAAVVAAAVAKKAAGSKTDVLLAARWVAVADEHEVIRTLAGALTRAGVSSRLWRPFEDALSDARCLHLFGMRAEFLPIVKAARKNGTRVVLSPESWREDADGGSYPRGWLEKSGAWFAKSVADMFPRTPPWQGELLRAVDLILPNSNVEAQRIARQFKLPVEGLRVVPHGVDPSWGEADPEPFCKHAGVREFVLYSGSIEPKNQQIGFLWAMKNVDVPIVVLGDAVPQCEWYLEECRSVAGPGVQFVSAASLDTQMLASAYAACRSMVVGSGVPAAERVALKAGASGTPLVLFEGGSESEYFGQQAIYIPSDDMAGIRRGVLAAMERKRSKNLAEHVCTYFSWNAVARALRNAYSRVWRMKANSQPGSVR